jgi:hypothetical protein
VIVLWSAHLAGFRLLRSVGSPTPHMISSGTRRNCQTELHGINEGPRHPHLLLRSVYESRKCLYGIKLQITTSQRIKSVESLLMHKHKVQVLSRHLNRQLNQAWGVSNMSSMDQRPVMIDPVVANRQSTELEICPNTPRVRKAERRQSSNDLSEYLPL